MSTMDTAGSVVRTWLVLSALGVAGGCAPQERTSRVCHVGIHVAFDIAEDAHVYPDATLPGVEGWVIDPAPLTRGEHPVERWWRNPSTCLWVGGWYAWGPPPPAAVIPGRAEGDTSVAALEAGDPSPGTQDNPIAEASTVRALIVIGEDPGSFEDAEAWARAVTSLGAAREQLMAPARATLWDAIAATCLGATEQDTILVAATGRGSPAAAGSLILGIEAVSYESLFSHIAQACQEAGLVVTVMDSSYTAEVASWPASAAPLIAWRGSDAAAPDAPRLRPGGGGLLSGALTAHLEALAQSDCLTSGDATPWEMARLFGDQDAILLRMRQLRWAETGPHHRQEAAAQALAGLPTDVVYATGAVPFDMGCAEDGDCLLREAACGLSPCRHLGCVAGRCVSVVDEDSLCDDQAVCTFDDRCDAQGLCRGTPVNCEDNMPCTIDTCLHDEGCVHTPQTGALCDDEDLCTALDECASSGFCVGAPIDCSDGNPCTFDWCDPLDGCVFEASHADCDDGNACTSPDYCEGGLCRGAPLACHDLDPCTADACDLDTGCVNPPMPEGAPCNDEDGCTQDDRCLEGECAGLDPSCDDGWACTLDTCESGTCVHLPEPGTCLDDEEGCIPVGTHPAAHPCEICATTNVLVPDPLAEGGPCPDDGVPCTTDLCQAGTCTHSNEPGTCHGPDGDCVAVGAPLTECLTCVGTGVAVPALGGTLCDDGQSCTIGDACNTAGMCTSVAVPCCPVVTGLTCGGVIEGTTATGLGAGAVSNWSCLPTPYPAAERAHHFRAPCDGEVIFQLQGQPGHLLFLIRGPPSNVDDPATQCLTGQCDTYTSSGLTQWMFLDQEYMLVVDGLNGSEGPYSLEVTCNCPGPAP